jgi:hypothetical protein
MAWDDDAYYETELEIPSGRYGKLLAMPGGVGPAGPVGEKGDVGEPGPIGPQGLPGVAGISVDPENATTVGSDGLVFTESSAVGRSVLTAVDGKAGRLALNAGPAFSVKDFGAKGDGTTDDTAAIQACVDAAGAASAALDTQNKRFVTVNFPPGMYVSSNITVPECVTLEGNSATIKAKAGTTGYLISFTGEGATGVGYLFYGGLRSMRVYAANDTDMLGGVNIKEFRQTVRIMNCAIEGFRDCALLVEGGNPYIKDNYLRGLVGDQSGLTAHKGVLHLQGQANDARISDNEINAARWHPNPEWQTAPTPARDMFVCAVVLDEVGYTMMHSNIHELAETGLYAYKVTSIHLSGERAEFGWGHGFHLVSCSGRISSCVSTDNSKVESGAFDGFHFGAGDVADQASNIQMTNCISRSNFGAFDSYAQHRWGVFDNGYNNIFGNAYCDFRSYGDVGVFSASDPSRVPGFYGGGPQYTIPQANSAFYLTGATPSVANRTMFRCDGSTQITDFTGAVNGQMFYLRGNGVVSVANNARIVMSSGAATVIPNGQWFAFMCHDGKIVQVDLSGSTLTGKTMKSGRYDNFLTTLGLPGIVLDAPSASVSSLRVSPGAAGGPLVLKAESTEANASFRLWPKGNGQVTIYSDATFSPSIYATGADANHNLRLFTKGTGVVQINGVQVETKGHTHTAAEVVGAPAWVAIPPTSSSPGTMGQMAHDGVGGFLYVCVAANQWRRTVLSTWI